jgi:hypothetical protein
MHSSAVARLRSRRDGATERRLCFLAIGDNGASTLTFHALPSPSAASKFLALLVALVALGTADAAAGDKLQGSAGAGYQYEMKTSQVLTDAQSLSTAISTSGTYWDSFTGTSWTNDIEPHVAGAKTTLSGTTYSAFTAKYTSTGIKDYIDAAIVSSDFQDLNPQISHPEAAAS